jgi:prophage antirepressor-like protein
MSKKYEDSSNFYLDVFNKILSFNKNQVFIIFDEDDNIWFGLKSLLLSLEYTDTNSAPKTLGLDEEYIINIEDLKVPESTRARISNLQPNTKMINNTGLYVLLGVSAKPLAKQFIRHYAKYIMPSITSTGKYISPKNDMDKIKDLNHKILELKHNTKTLINNQTNIIYPKGSAVYIIKQKYDGTIYYKVGHTINLNSRLKTYNTGLVNKIHYNFYILIEDPKIDICIKNAMKDKEYIKNKEFYKTSLISIFNFINKCKNCTLWIL